MFLYDANAERAVVCVQTVCHNHYTHFTCSMSSITYTEIMGHFLKIIDLRTSHINWWSRCSNRYWLAFSLGNLGCRNKTGGLTDVSASYLVRIQKDSEKILLQIIQVRCRCWSNCCCHTCNEILWNRMCNWRSIAVKSNPHYWIYLLFSEISQKIKGKW